MTVPAWTPVLGDITTPGSISSLSQEIAARMAADAILAAAIAAIPPSVDAYTKVQSDARYQTPQTTIAGYGITDAVSTGGAVMTGPLTGGVQGTNPAANVTGISTYAWWIPATTASGTRLIYGVSGSAFIDGAGDASTPSKVIAGINAQAASLGTRTGAMDQMYGGFFLAQKQNTVGDLSFMAGAFVQGDNMKGLTGRQSGFEIFNRVRNTATSTVVAGIHIEKPQIDSGGTVPDLYGMLIDDPTGQAGTVTRTWGIVALGNVPSVFGGSITALSFSGDGSALTSLAWGHLTGTPTTVAGYSISDVYTKTLADARFLRDIPILGSDNFPQGASTALTTLVTGQTWVMWNGAWVTDGAGNCKENASVRNAAVVWDTGLTEQDYEIFVKNGTVATGAPGAICRGVSAGNYIFSKWTNGALTINKMISGTPTQLASVAAIAIANVVYKMRIVATGNVITVIIDGPTGTNGTTLSFTLTGSDATFFVGTFVGQFLTAASGTNAGYLFSAVAFRNYLDTQVTLDARYLRTDVIGQTIAPRGPNLGTVIGLNIGGLSNQVALKCWGQFLLGQNNDALQNSTGSGFLHVGAGASGGVTLGLNNGTVHLKAVAAGISSPVAPFIQTTGGAPALASSSGVAGQLGWDASNFYVCVAANTWKRVAIATF